MPDDEASGEMDGNWEEKRRIAANQWFSFLPWTIPGLSLGITATDDSKQWLLMADARGTRRSQGPWQWQRLSQSGIPVSPPAATDGRGPQWEGRYIHTNSQTPFPAVYPEYLGCLRDVHDHRSKDRIVSTPYFGRPAGRDGGWRPICMPRITESITSLPPVSRQCARITCCIRGPSRLHYHIRLPGLHPLDLELPMADTK
ncbi:hypothetical protein BO70DRAFT_196035 [Aspergillus heteromorphus CBS 117.55]|uniref:Uncharacterized protein n=1 Tax=Aspergillus heteromorphus CBS 117.55 TaxID=1448321 RepID=A0A317WMC5_9EURO|nr:uncharacterized protein BO70DRAFT_196035 [Aspergillus heteromorphus CBS 117.55]PWY87519.1 hypothetical protein BO70DRAFT_196035 [Aspergillus heteromorphus CBS 117.55]